MIDNIDSLDEKGLSQLHYATSKDNMPEVQRLLELGAQINVVGADGLRPIHLCIAKGYYNLLDFIIQNGAIFTTEGLGIDFKQHVFNQVRYMAPELVQLLKDAVPQNLMGNNNEPDDQIN